MSAVIDLPVFSGGGGGSGDVVGPASSTDNAVVRFDGTTGKLIQGSLAIIDDSGNITGLGIATLGTSGSQTGTINLNGTTSGTFTLKPADAAGTWSLTLPTSSGTSGYFLQTDGTGVSSWASAAPSIGNVIGGATDGSVLFIGSGATLAQDNTNFFYDDSINTLFTNLDMGSF